MLIHTSALYLSYHFFLIIVWQTLDHRSSSRFQTFSPHITLFAARISVKMNAIHFWLGSSKGVVCMHFEKSSNLVECNCMWLPRNSSKLRHSRTLIEQTRNFLTSRNLAVSTSYMHNIILIANNTRYEKPSDPILV